ncbi:MAG: threonine synthase [bacterium]|nr:threonine synthase [bacterium]
MKFYSTKRQAPETNFKEAIFKGLPEDNGLYLPESIPVLSEDFIQNISNYTLPEIAFEVASKYVGDEIPEDKLQSLVAEVMNFEIPIVQVEPNIYSLELFHGPTLAFKDVGARFLARCLSYFVEKAGEKLTILVATSGDTGSAVANGFYGVEGIDVVLLYPSGKVSKIQEMQLTTLGKNISALEVNGTFDDCQKMVKDAFLDVELKKEKNLTSANSINIARLIPQSFYYFHAYAQLEDKSKPVVFSVPSGNYGNLSAGLLAKRMGLPIHKMVASSNINKIVPDYLKEGVFNPKASEMTISNAMDVGNPSNFARMYELYGESVDAMREDIQGYWFSDNATREIMREVYDRTNYMLDPHGAVGYLGLTSFINKKDVTGIFLETAHPAKFKDVVDDTLGESIEIPSALAECMKKEKQSTVIEPGLESLKNFLLDNK